MASRKKPTVTSLAKELGVSRQTISNATHFPERVSPETLARVRAAMDAAGYVPSRVGRSLRTQRAGAFALRLFPTFDGINGNILDRFLHSLTSAAQERDQLIIVFEAHSHDDEVRRLRQMKNAGMIDGAILAGTIEGDPRPRALAEDEIPAAVFGRPWGEESSPLPWVDVDGAAGTATVTEHLIRAGHRAIGWIGWPHSGVGADRFAGFRRAAGDLFRDELCWHNEDRTDIGAEAAGVLRERGASAVVCASDTLALGVHSSGAFDIHHIVGFDDTPVARALGMNSVSQPVDEAARACLDAALALSHGNEATPHLLLAPRPALHAGIWGPA